jgi:ATP-dependent Lon protease
MSVLLGGLDRFEIARVLTREPYLVAEVRYAYEPRTVPSDEIKAYSVAIINSIKELVQLNPLFKEELSMLLNQGNLDEPSRLADLAAFLTSAGGAELQGVLETLEIRERMQAVLQLLRKELDISKLQSKIRQQLDERISKQQREFFLREQLKAIKQELGLEKDDKEAEIQKFVERLGSRTPSEEAKARIDDEVEKLRLLEPSSPEFSLTRNYLDWLTVLPWGVRSDEHVEMKHVRAALNENHFGLDDVKERILEFVAAGLLKGGFGGSIICLAGPPGVGKTSIGRSVAKALNREFYRFSLGGMRDEAEIKGHRRTYIGAMPGKFVQALRVCKTDNPVIMLDEIDKIGASFRGDPASALLEALDPEQNRDFLDHYLDVRFDLSNVLFLCTANQLDTIPPPLLDRMEVMKLSGYILEEKLEIAQRFIVPREIAALGLTKDRLTIKRQAVAEMIDGYARDAGLRNLEQQIKKIVRKCAVRILEEQPRYIVIDKTDVASLLGKRVFVEERILANPVPGVVMGLAWTSLGGDTLTIEATKVRSERGGFKQTGQLGKVMVESSEIAYTHARASCALAPETQSFFDQHFIHLHVPAGATPKDGPSAGITMAVALYTLAHGRAVRASFAMTGELDLSGHVLPVGGIREKLIAAKRAKVKHVILPRANEPDYEALPPHVKKGITVHMVERFSEVIALAVDGRTKPAGSARRKR